MKKVLSLVLSLIMVLSMSICASATTLNKATDKQVKKQFINNINLIEQDIENHGTSVLQELNKEKNRLQVLAKLMTNKDDKDKLENLIRNYTNMISEYENYKNSGKNQIGLNGIEHPVLSPATAAIVSYFLMNKYALSAELLTYAKEESSGGTYEPYFGNQVYETKKYKSIVKKIRRSGKKSGSSNTEFNKGGTVADNDLYYAIHGCAYTFNSGKLTIHDTYDFALNKDYEGLAGTAVNTMYLAQQMGVIVPYDVLINVNY